MSSPSLLKRRVAAILLGVAAAPALLAATASPSERIDAYLAQPRFNGAHWGVAVVSLDDGHTVYAHDADALLQPASATKLFTTALALGTLGPDGRLATRVLGKPPQDGALDGPLLLYGMGDPTLGVAPATTDWATQLAGQLAARGLHRVEGDLIADDSYFQTPLMGSGWEAIDLQSWFGMPTSALSVDENLVALSLTPGARSGEPVQASFRPADAAPALVNRLLTAPARERSDVNLYRAPGSATLHAFGSLAVDSKPVTYRLAMVDPARVAGQRLLDAMKAQGIDVKGSLRVLHWPEDDASLLAGTDVLASIASPPVMDILHQGLKRSQNLYLQNLWLAVGVLASAQARTQGTAPPGFLTTEAWGARALDDLLARIGVAPTAVHVEEGSGLSRKDLASPAAMTRLLSYLAAQPYAQAVADALPLAGVDGTLQSRLKKTAAENNLRAKTGSMALVHCLAGYVTDASGERLAFAIMLNNYEAADGDPSPSRDIDAIAEMITGFGR